MDKNITFEDGIIALEETVKKLESGNLSLDDSLKAFEDAVKLAQICNSRLEAAEQKVKILVESVDGSITDMPFKALGNED